MTAIDASDLRLQAQWSRQTFGPGRRTEGLLAHIAEELEEVRANPDDITEWADIVILALDGAWRHGHEPEAILSVIKAKWAVNRQRAWPDWRQFGEDQAIGHVEEAP